MTERRDRKHVTIRLSPELAERLTTEARERMMGRNFFIGKLLEEAVDHLIPVEELSLTRDPPPRVQVDDRPLGISDRILPCCGHARSLHTADPWRCPVLHDAESHEHNWPGGMGGISETAYDPEFGWHAHDRRRRPLGPPDHENDPIIDEHHIPGQSTPRPVPPVGPTC